MPAPFPRAVDRHGIRYTLLEPPTPDRVRFSFTGPFESAEVTWDATLLALPGSSTDPQSTADTPRPDYIDVGEPGEQGRRLVVALAIPVIDDAAILRTIIMVRQYRRLRRGRHDFSRAGDR